MAFEFKLPDVGEGLHEAEIVRWLVSEGDQLAEDQPMLEIQTDKAVVEIAAPVPGKVAALHAAPGDIVPIGSVLITIHRGESAETVHQAPPPEEEGALATEAGDPTDGAVNLTAPPSPTADQTAPRPPSSKVLAAPSTRRLARELGVDLQQVPGSGPAGRILDQDVEQFAAARDAGAAAVDKGRAGSLFTRPATSSADGSGVIQREERIQLRGLRRRIAQQMVLSKSTIPHATHMDEVDVTELVQIREDALPLAAEKNIPLTYLPFIIKAVIAGLKEHPELNASLDADGEAIVVKHYYNIGIATDTDDGLMVPVIKQADRKSIFDLAKEIERLSQAARRRTIQLEDLQDGTFSITNVGALGGVYATPIINAPEAAILAVHRIRQRPAVHQGEIVPRHMLTLSLAFDHRVADGAAAVRFLNRVMAYLERPSRLFLELI